MKPVTDDETKATIAANVNAIIAALGWSQAKLAKESGENTMLISSCCNGKSIINSASLKRIADALGVTTDRLYEQPTHDHRPYRRKKTSHAA